MARRRIMAAGILNELVEKTSDLPRSDASAAIRRLTGATRCMRQAALEMFERAPDGPTPQELWAAVEALQLPAAGGEAGGSGDAAAAAGVPRAGTSTESVDVDMT